MSIHTEMPVLPICVFVKNSGKPLRHKPRFVRGNMVLPLSCNKNISYLILIYGNEVNRAKGPNRKWVKQVTWWTGDLGWYLSCFQFPVQEHVKDRTRCQRAGRNVCCGLTRRSTLILRGTVHVLFSAICLPHGRLITLVLCINQSPFQSFYSNSILLLERMVWVLTIYSFITYWSNNFSVIKFSNSR